MNKPCQNLGYKMQEQEYKQFKDPIYGYVKIPANYVNNIIDSAEFQRLRRIVQTSYSPLYSAAVHNRFIHSIGVYHLGTIAAKSVFADLEKVDSVEFDVDLKRIKEVFLLACLLHDVGHAPFSHTGEKYYLDENGGYSELHNKLTSFVNTESFKNDIPENSKSAAPHEIMSAIVALKCFDEYFQNDFEKELFVRCITGYKYSENSLLKSIYNCIITLLNSKVIDVDRLDYLIRDAYFTGFETVNIDYARLLSSLTIVIENNKASLGYNKNAISVIENVVYAHDAERKWIQTHPIVLYDMYIIQHVIDNLNKRISASNDEKLFSLESLSLEGHTLNNSLEISLLCDDDIVHLLKKNKQDPLCMEYFSRKDRRHPLWKSESEYKAYISLRFGSDGIIQNNFNEALSETEKYMRKFSEGWIINDSVIAKIEQDLKNLDDAGDQIDQSTKNAQRTQKEKILKVINALKSYANRNGMDCDFVLLEASNFYSGFNKDDLSNIPIRFPKKTGKNIFCLSEVVSLLGSSEIKNNRFFYLFYKEGATPINREELCTEIYKALL